MEIRPSGFDPFEGKKIFGELSAAISRVGKILEPDSKKAESLLQELTAEAVSIEDTDYREKFIERGQGELDAIFDEKEPEIKRALSTAPNATHVYEELKQDWHEAYNLPKSVAAVIGQPEEEKQISPEDLMRGSSKASLLGAEAVNAVGGLGAEAASSSNAAPASTFLGMLRKWADNLKGAIIQPLSPPATDKLYQFFMAKINSLEGLPLDKQIKEMQTWGKDVVAGKYQSELGFSFNSSNPPYLDQHWQQIFKICSFSDFYYNGANGMNTKLIAWVTNGGVPSAPQEALFVGVMNTLFTWEITNTQAPYMGDYLYTTFFGTDLFKKGPHGSPFFAFPGIRPEQLSALWTALRSAGITPPSMQNPPSASLLDIALYESYKVMNDTSRSTSERNLFAYLFNQVMTIEGTAGTTIDTLTQWCVNVIFDKDPTGGALFDALSNNRDIQLYFCQLCNLKPDLLPAFLATKAWLNSLKPDMVNTAEYRAASKVFAELYQIIITGTVQDFQNWFKGQFATHDIYWQSGCYDAQSASTIQSNLVKILGMDIAGITQMDTIYGQASAFGQNLTGPDKTLWSELLSELTDLGSYGSFSALQSWAVATIDDTTTPSIFFSASPTTRQMFTSLTGTILEPLRFKLSQLSGLSGPQAKFVAALLAQINALGINTSVDSLMTAIQNNVYKNDVYFAFAGINPDEIAAIFQLSANALPGFNLSTPNATLLDRALYLSYQYSNPGSATSGGVFKTIFDKLVQQGSTWNFTTGFQAWIKSEIFDNFWGKYPNFTISDAKHFFEVTGLQVPPTPTPAPPDPFPDIDTDIHNHLDPLVALNALWKSMHAHYKNFPDDLSKLTNVQWQQLTAIFNSEYKVFANLVARQDWGTLNRQFPGLNINSTASGNKWINVFKSSISMVQGWSPQGYGNAIKLYQTVLNEIDELKKQGKGPSDLAAWARSINLSNYPGLRQTDIDFFNSLKNLKSL